MAKFIKGDVVVVPFPFSNLAHAKRRPAFVLAVLPGDDYPLPDYQPGHQRRICPQVTDSRF